MIKVTLLVGIIVAASCVVLPSDLSQVGTTQCQKYYVYTREKGCVKSCSHPEFAQCPDVFATIWDPKFCALGKDGTWTSFTFACQACLLRDSDYIAVADGKCEDTGVALPPAPQCEEHEIYTKERGCITACSDPSWKKCGNIFPLLYKPSHCALGKDGKWTSVTFACQACPNSYPNTQFLGVSEGKCQDEQISIPVPPVDENKCRHTEECPYDWQTCHNGTCQDRCVFMKCIGCQYGQCGFEQANGRCHLSNSRCKNERWACVGSRCTDLCLKKKCPAYHKCNPRNGACEQLKYQP